HRVDRDPSRKVVTYLQHPVLRRLVRWAASSRYGYGVLHDLLRPLRSEVVLQPLRYATTRHPAIAVEGVAECAGRSVSAAELTAGRRRAANCCLRTRDAGSQAELAS